MLWSAIARLLAIVAPFVPAVRSQELVRLALVIANQGNIIGKVLEPPQAKPKAMTQHSSVIEVTTDPTRIDLDRVHDWIARKSYWAGQMPRRLFDRAVRGSLCFGAVEQGATVGFCRVISDRATFAYVSDMFVDPDHRGKGIGKAIMAAIMAHPDLQDLRRWVLVTGDAHGLYASFGFEALTTPERFMERRDPDVYQRMAIG